MQCLPCVEFDCISTVDFIFLFAFDNCRLFKCSVSRVSERWIICATIVVEQVRTNKNRLHFKLDNRERTV